MKTSITLPGSKLYDTEIQIESFTVEDVARIMTIYENEDTSQNELLKLIESKLNVSISTIYENDLSYIMWWLRFNTFPDINKRIEYVCPHCGLKLELNLTPDIVLSNILPLKSDYTKDGIELKLSDDKTVNAKLLTIGDIKAAENFMRDVLNTEDESIRQLLLSLQGIEPQLDIYTKYKKFISGNSKLIKLSKDNKLTPSEFYNINKFYLDYKFGIKDILDFNCINPECNKLLRLPLEVSLLDFFPSIYSN